MLSERTAQALTELKQVLAKDVVERQYAEATAKWQAYGQKGKALSIRDVGYHLSFFIDAIRVNEPDVFVAYARWAKQLFSALELPENTMNRTLACLDDALKALLPDDMARLCADFIHLAREALADSCADRGSHIDSQAPLGRLAEAYLRALLERDKRRASRLILDAVDQGVAVRDIYLEVFQKAQYEIGRLWLYNRISVAQEHYSTAVTQMIISQLYPRIFSAERNGKTFVGACVQGELHEIGMRMLCDVFELEGWDTLYLGANVPTRSLLQTLEAEKTDVVGISVAMPFHFSKLRHLVTAIREHPALKNVKILVGGQLFNQFPRLRDKVTAHGWAQDATGAVSLAGRLVART